MKKIVKVLLVLLCILTALGTLASCSISDILGGLGIGGETEWKPTGKEVTLLKKNITGDYVIVHGGSDESAAAAATNLKDILTEEGYSTKGMVMTTGVSDVKTEIVVGPSDRQVSIDAMALLNKKMAKSEDDIHFVFHYADEKLAIVANSPMAYEMAIIKLIDMYSANAKISFKDTLKEYVSFSESDYLDYKFEKYLDGRKDIEKQHDKDLDDLLEKLEDQRDDLVSSGFFGSSTKDIGASKWGDAPVKPSEDHPRLLLNKDTLVNVKRTLMLTGDKNSASVLGYFDASVSGDAILPPAKYEGTNETVDTDDIHNFSSGILDRIQAKALAYLVTGDAYYGYEAIYYIKNYLKSLDIVQIASDQCREYGYVMYTAGIVYDWCYPLLTDLDKEQIIAGVENRICRYKNQIGAAMEVGFPPAGQAVVVGHGAERQILRDYLAFATAIYGDNDSWWDYIAARVCNAFVPPRNYYYQSGLIHQGAGYTKGRYISDLFSAWILLVAADYRPYVGQAEVTKGILGLEMAKGIVFNSGDHTGDGENLADYVHLAYITAYVENDPVLLAQANYLKGAGALSGNFNYITSVTFTALRGLSDLKPAEDRYEGMELIQYNGSPLGQYVIREAWDSVDTASVMMRIKEVYPGNHDHHDAGTFEIYYKGALTTDGGVYNNYGHVHTKYFHQATVSHNGLLIYNSAHKDDLSGWYSGGQEIKSTPSSVTSWESGNLDTGKVTGRQHGYSDKDETSPLYAYIAGDITKAYAADTVNYVGRRMLTVYTGDEDFPMAFFVYDDITSDKKAFKKTFLLQISSDVAPVIDEKEQTVTTEHEGGKLILTCLSDDVKIEGIGGRNEGKYSAKASQNYMINGKQLSPKSNTADDKHWGRVEISNEKDVDTIHFLNVITVTDAGSKKTASVRDVSSAEGVEGAVFDKKIVALFATSRERATSELSCKTSGSAEMSYYVSGVAEGEWTVTVDGKKIGSFEASAEGGLLTFTAPAGEVVISPAK